MIQIQKLLHNERSLSFFSFLIGMGLVIMMFHKPLRSKITLAVPIEEIHGKMVTHNGKCYTYRAEDRACEISSSK
jgi:endoglucanase Acf2